jgi:hypothetical protein
MLRILNVEVNLQDGKYIARLFDSAKYKHLEWFMCRATCLERAEAEAAAQWPNAMYVNGMTIGPDIDFPGGEVKAVA